MPATHDTTPFRSPTGRLLKGPRPGRTAAAVLTTPTVDYAGDLVHPAGGDWSKYPAHPFVNWNHGVVVGRGTVTRKSVPWDGGSFVGPVGTTAFAQTAKDLDGLDLGRHSLRRSLEAAGQVWRLVSDGVADGVSIEFTPAGPLHKAFKPTGRWSALEDRPAYEFTAWTGLGWAHTPSPVNPDARLLLDGVGGAAVEKAVRIARDGLYAGRPVLGVVRKAFAAYAAVDPPRFHRTRPETKAMDPEDDDPLGPPNPELGGPDLAADPMAPPPEADPEPAGDSTPTAQAAYDAAQGILDICDQTEAALAKSEHVKGKKKLMGLLEQIRGYAEDFSAVAEQVEADVDGADAEPEPAPADDAPPAADDGADEPEDDGGDDPPFPKAVRRDPESGLILTKSRYKPRRFRFADLADPAPEPAPPAEDPAKLKALNRVLRSTAREVTLLARAAARRPA